MCPSLLFDGAPTVLLVSACVACVYVCSCTLCTYVRARARVCVYLCVCVCVFAGAGVASHQCVNFGPNYRKSCGYVYCRPVGNSSRTFRKFGFSQKASIPIRVFLLTSSVLLFFLFFHLRTCLRLC